MQSKFVVTLFKEEKPSDEYRQGLESAGFTVRFLPVLQFTPLAEEQLRDVLEDGHSFTHAILSSAQAVKALKNQWHESMAAPWSEKKWFVVGKKTAKELQNILPSVRPIIADNATLLRDRVTQDVSEKANAIFFAGNQALAVIPRALEEANCPYRRINIYCTTTKCPEWERAEREILCFFSPSGVEAVVRDGCCSTGEDIFVAFGPSTKAKLLEKGARSVVVCQAPNAEQLVVAVKEAIVQFT